MVVRQYAPLDLIAPRGRRLPHHTVWVTLVAAVPDAARPVGRYAFLHTPWAAGVR